MRKGSLCLLLAAALAVLAGCTPVRADATAPRVSVAGLRVVQMGVLEQRYALLLRIQNPNDFALPITGMEYTLALNGRPFAQGVSDRAVTVPAYGSEAVEVEVTSNLGQVVEQLNDLSKGKGGLRYRISGHLKLAGRAAPLPFDYRAELLPRSSPATTTRPTGDTTTLLWRATGRRFAPNRGAV